MGGSSTSTDRDPPLVTVDTVEVTTLSDELERSVKSKSMHKNNNTDVVAK